MLLKRGSRCHLPNHFSPKFIRKDAEVQRSPRASQPRLCAFVPWCDGFFKKSSHKGNGEDGKFCIYLRFLRHLSTFGFGLFEIHTYIVHLCRTIYLCRWEIMADTIFPVADNIITITLIITAAINRTRV